MHGACCQYRQRCSPSLRSEGRVPKHTMDAFAYGDPYLQFGTKVEKGGRKARCKTGVGGWGGRIHENKTSWSC